MADHKQQGSPTNDAVGTGVANSVVSDLMRVYENLTQSSTPQAGVTDASKSLSMAYDKTVNNTSLPTQSQPAQHGYSIPPNVYQQAGTSTTPTNHALHATAPPAPQTHPHAHSTTSAANNPYEQHLVANPGYVSIPMRLPAGSDGNTQRSGEESQHNSRGESSYPASEIVRSSSTSSRTSMVLSSSSVTPHHLPQQPPADASSESDKSGAGGRTRKKRKQQEGAGGKKQRGKKSKKEDGRWSKRFTWPEDLHRDFVSAIFDVGLKHSSPSTIMEHMPKHDQITTERIKSHLQKYRLHRVKSKKEFISSYEASLRTQQSQSNIGGPAGTLVSGGGEVAAHLTSNALGITKSGSPAVIPNEGPPSSSNSNGLTSLSSGNLRDHHSPKNGDSDNSLMLPQLTEEEKQSPIGAAMGYLMGLFFSLKQQLIIQRSLEANRENAKGSALLSSSPSAGNSNLTPTAATATAAAVAASVDYGAEADSQSGTAAQQAANVLGAGSVRTNIEENSMMKREMRNQMALQNKMRALKQQELAKYKNTVVGTDHDNRHLSVTGGSVMDSASNMDQGGQAIGVDEHHHRHPQHVSTSLPSQGAGEMAGTDFPNPAGHTPQGNGNDGGNNGSSLLGIENSEEFWHNDVVDDQLFEFLMNN